MDKISILDYFKTCGEEKHLVSSPPKEADKKVITLQQLDNITYERMNDSEYTTLEITITFKPEYRNMYEDEVIAKMTSKYLRRGIRPTFNYVLYPEYGDNINLHYHGILYTKDKRIVTYISNLSKYIKRDVGINTIRQIRNTGLYMDYMMKERKDIPNIERLIIFKI